MFFKVSKFKFLWIRNLVLLLSFLAIIYVLFGLFKGEFFDSHDSVFHLVRVVEFDKAIKSGHFPPRWAPDLMNGLGVPVFNYFYPLFYYLTEPLMLVGVSAAIACKIILVLAYLFGFFFSWKFLANYFRPVPSLIGAFFYVFAPYMFLDLYVRGNFAEFLALMMIPAVFWAGNNVFKNDKNEKKILSVLILAFFVLSHNIVVMLAIGWFAFFIFVNLACDFFKIKKEEKRIDFTKSNGKKFFSFIILALGLSAFFWLPALMEIPLTYLGVEKVYSWGNHFPTIKQLIYSPWQYGHSLPGPGDYMSFQVGPMHLFLMVGSVLAFVVSFWGRRKLTKKEFLYLFFLFSFVLLIFLMNYRSTFIWRNIPILERVQFPWRLLGFALFAAIFLIAFFLEKLFLYVKNKTSLKIIIVMVIYFLTFMNYYHYPSPKQYISTKEALAFDRAKGTTAASNELLPVWAPKENPEKISLKDAVFCQRFRCQKNVNFKEERDVVFQKFYFPSWQAFIDGRKASVQLEDKTGLLRVSVPAGQHEIFLKLGQTRMEKWANFISLVFLAVLVLIGVKYKRND